MLFTKNYELHIGREMMQYGNIASDFACAREDNTTNSPAHNRGRIEV